MREDCSTLDCSEGGRLSVCIALYCEYILSVFMLGSRDSSVVLVE